MIAAFNGFVLPFPINFHQKEFELVHYYNNEKHYSIKYSFISKKSFKKYINIIEEKKKKKKR